MAARSIAPAVAVARIVLALTPRSLHCQPGAEQTLAERPARVERQVQVERPVRAAKWAAPQPAEEVVLQAVDAVHPRRGATTRLSHANSAVVPK